MNKIEADEDDGRPLTPAERKALRKLLAKEDTLLEVAKNYDHADWFVSFTLSLSKWIAAIAALIVIAKTYYPWSTK